LRFVDVAATLAHATVETTHAWKKENAGDVRLTRLVVVSHVGGGRFATASTAPRHFANATPVRFACPFATSHTLHIAVVLAVGVLFVVIA